MDRVPEYAGADVPARALLFILLCLALLIPLVVVTWYWWRSWLCPSRFQKAARSSCPAPARLEQLLTGDLPPSEQANLTAHLEACEDCQRAIDKLAAGKDSWSDVAKHLRPNRPRPEDPLGKVMEKLKAEASAVETHDQGKLGEDLSLEFLSPSAQPGNLGRLGPYEVLEVIGRGGMGVVLKALDPSLQRMVAIKVLAPQLATSGTARRRFTREAQAAAAVSHDHVVTIHAVEEANGLPYLVMQYIAGISLQERLDRGGPVELKEILRIGMQTASGLAAAHAQGLVHRDIKPANILLENGVQRVKITDFGLARAADDASLTQSGVVAGTPQYMAPEQARGEAVDHRADLFSLGSVLYAMCTGRPPFCASTAMAVLRRVSDDTPRAIKELNAEIPDWLNAVVEKLHAKEPSDRFQSAREVAELLNQHLAQLQLASWTPPPGGLSEKMPASAARGAGPITTVTICPSCGSHLHVPDKMVGRVLNCPHCSKPFQVADTSQEIQLIQKLKPQVVQPVKRKRRIPLVAPFLGGFLALMFLFCGGVGLYLLSRSTPSTMPATPFPAPAALNSFQEAFSWFPADASFFGTIDLKRALWLNSTVDQNMQDRLLDQFVAPHIRRQLGTGQPGNPRINRISFAYCADRPNDPQPARLFVRLTGYFDHQRVLAVLSRELPGATVRQPSGHGTSIAIVESKSRPLACALIGNTDVVLASTAGPNGGDDPLNSVLHIRAGSGKSLVKARSTELALAPRLAIGVLIGRVPEALGKKDIVQNQLAVLPDQVTAYLAPDPNFSSFLLSFVLRMKEPGQDRELLTSLARFKSEGIDKLVKAYPQIPYLSQGLRETLDGIKVDAEQGVVSGDLRFSTSTMNTLGDLLKQILKRG